MENLQNSTNYPSKSMPKELHDRLNNIDSAIREIIDTITVASDAMMSLHDRLMKIEDRLKDDGR